MSLPATTKETTSRTYINSQCTSPFSFYFLFYFLYFLYLFIIILFNNLSIIIICIIPTVNISSFYFNISFYLRVRLKFNFIRLSVDLLLLSVLLLVNWRLHCFLFFILLNILLFIVTYCCGCALATHVICHVNKAYYIEMNWIDTRLSVGSVRAISCLCSPVVQFWSESLSVAWGCSRSDQDCTIKPAATCKPDLVPAGNSGARHQQTFSRYWLKTHEHAMCNV